MIAVDGAGSVKLERRDAQASWKISVESAALEPATRPPTSL